MHQQRTVTGRQRQQSAAGRTTTGLLAACAAACLLATACGGPTRQDSEAAVNIAAADPSLPKPAALSSLSTVALDAFLDFNAAIGLDPGSATLRALRGSAYSKSGQSEMAFFDLDRAIALQPGHAMAHLH